MLDEKILNEARSRLTLGPRVPGDDELEARYVGEYQTEAQLYRALFLMDAPHIDVNQWPYCHIDWERAAAAASLGGSRRHLLEIEGHWFDAFAEPPVVAMK